MELMAAIIVLLAFSVLSFWQGIDARHAVLWLITAAIAIISGIFFFDKYPDYLGITLALTLFVYSILCIGRGYQALLRGHEADE